MESLDWLPRTCFYRKLLLKDSSSWMGWLQQHFCSSAKFSRDKKRKVAGETGKAGPPQSSRCKITKINKRSLKESIVDLSGGYNVGCLFALPLAWIISSGYHLQIQIHRTRSFLKVWDKNSREVRAGERLDIHNKVLIYITMGISSEQRLGICSQGNQDRNPQKMWWF